MASTKIIAFIGGTTAASSSLASSLTLTYSPTAGNFVHIVAITGAGSTTQMSCADNNGNALALVQNMTVRGGPTGGAQFCGVAVTGATSYVVSWTNTSGCAAALAEYSNVASTGASSKTEGTSNTSWSNAQNITNAGNWIATAFNISLASGTDSTTVTTGNLRETSSSVSYGSALAVAIDNTNSSGNTAAGVIGGTPFSWSCASVELVGGIVATYSISGNIGAGTTGEIVYIVPVGDYSFPQPSTTVADSSNNYSFSGLADGVYILYTAGAPLAKQEVILCGSNVANVNFAL